MTEKKKKARKQICTWIPIELVATTIIVIITLTALRSTTAKIAFVGVIADVFNVIMYASPTLAVKKVIETKSVQYMPFWLSFAGFINAIVWTAYSLIHKIDLYILISNGIGSLWGLTQLIIYAIYCKSTPKSEESDKKQQQQQEIQLSEV
ncbi:bidirectional sugar transporter SWEET8-like [Carica papaya]|uniref:bidirectional sugar transporter SWEET8-like n=1 Tax=Carica papaya TaxID=3649 RepID=UPI000B8CA676|nr:bidirectional sugar transporter SWEET8-like [Carica papaya]